MAKEEKELTEAEEILSNLGDPPKDSIFDVTIKTAKYIRGTYKSGREVSVSINKDVAKQNNIDFIPLGQLDMLIACKHIRAIGRTSRIPRGTVLTKDEVAAINLEKARETKRVKAEEKKREEEIEAEVEKRLAKKLKALEANQKLAKSGAK